MSSFDRSSDPPYVTVKVGKRRMVGLSTGGKDPARIDSDSPAVATGKIVKSEDGWHSIEITGKQMGTANLRAVADHPDPRWRAVADIILGRIEVDVCGPQITYLNFHFVTDGNGQTTSRSAASVQSDIFPQMKQIYAAANIDFAIHKSRTVPVTDVDFTTTNQTGDQITAILDNLRDKSKAFDTAKGHLNVWCVKEWGAADDPAKPWDEIGRSRGIVIIIEDKTSRAGPGALLAHEVGHSYGLPHNQTKSNALMADRGAAGGLKLFKDEYRKILRLK
jgi:hypothetical protein